MEPLTRGIEYISASLQTRLLAYAALGLAGLLLGGWLAVVLDSGVSKIAALTLRRARSSKKEDEVRQS